MSPIPGILLKLASVAMFIVMSSCVKYAADWVPAGQSLFFRNFFAFPVIVAWLLWRGELRTGLRTSRPLGHLWRGLVGAAAMGLMFLGLALLPLPEVTAIFYATPLLVTVFAAMFLGEAIRAFRLGTILLGLLGVAIVMQPRLTGLETGNTAQALGALAVLMASVFAALAQITVRHLTKTEHVAAIVFYFTAISTVLSALTFPFGWSWPPVTALLALIMSGLAGGAAQIMLTASYRFADAAVIASFDFMGIVLALIVGYVLFEEVPTSQMLIGAVLVVIAGLALAWRERYRQLHQGRVKLVK